MSSEEKDGANSTRRQTGNVPDRRGDQSPRQNLQAKRNIVPSADPSQPKLTETATHCKQRDQQLVSKTDQKTSRKISCKTHQDRYINGYCKTCKLPVCPECVSTTHSTHDTEELTVMAQRFKRDLQEVSGMATKQLTALNLIAKDLESNRSRMEENLDKVDRSIIEVKEAICKLVEERAEELQKKVNSARTQAKKSFTEAIDNVSALQENTSKIETLLAQDSLNPRTLVQAPNILEQFLRQQQRPVPSVVWNMKDKTVPLDSLTIPAFLGNAIVEEPVLANQDVEKGKIESPVLNVKLHYSGEEAPSCVAPLFSNLICVTHYDEKYIWVYTETGQLRKKVHIPGTQSILGMVMVSGERGQLALVDGTQKKVLLATLSADVESVHHTTNHVPFAPTRISINRESELVVWRNHSKRCVVITTDGKKLFDLQLSLPSETVDLVCVTKSSSGYVACDQSSKAVFFTNERGKVLSTCTLCQDPWRAAHTSSGLVLIPGGEGHNVAVFTEAGDFLGAVQGDDVRLEYPYVIHIDEDKRLLYVGCGPVGGMEVCIYRFSPSETLPLPFRRNVRKLEMSVEIATV